jgi:hypothetical protein
MNTAGSPIASGNVSNLSAGLHGNGVGPSGGMNMGSSNHNGTVSGNNININNNSIGNNNSIIGTAGGSNLSVPPKGASSVLSSIQERGERSTVFPGELEEDDEDVENEFEGELEGEGTELEEEELTGQRKVDGEELKRGMDEERVVKSGYLMKKGEKRKVSLEGSAMRQRQFARMLMCSVSVMVMVELEEEVVCAPNGEVGLLP